MIHAHSPDLCSDRGVHDRGRDVIIGDTPLAPPHLVTTRRMASGDHLSPCRGQRVRERATGMRVRVVGDGREGAGDGAGERLGVTVTCVAQGMSSPTVLQALMYSV